MVNKFPPDNYIQVPSALPGIEVYAPKPVGEAKTPDVVDFDCPQCGAATAYSLEDGGLKCAHCGYFEPPPAEIVGRGAQDFEFKVDTLEQAAHGWGAKRSDLVCSNCGAETSLPVGLLSTGCPFCGSNKVLQRDGAQTALRPRFLIPFRVDQGQAANIASEWLGKSWLVPDVVKKSTYFTAFTPLYLPYWTFDATAYAKWRAQVGYDETERYYDSSDKTWKTRTVTRWRWEDGQVRQAYDDVLISGTDRLSALHLGKIQNFKLADLVVYSPEYLAGIGANAYDVPLEAAWAKGRHAIRADVHNLCHQQIHGDHVRNFEMAMDLADESWRYILLPVLVNAFPFREKTYRIMINGQTGRISGQRPVDWPKVWFVNAMLLLPGILTALIAYVLQFSNPDAFLFVWVGLVILVVGLIGMGILLSHAASLDDV